MSGITPIEYNVVVKPERVEEQTKGGLYVPDGVREKDQYGEFKGTLVALSPMAFSFDEWPEDEPKPHVGQRVVFVRYAGTLVKGDDDEDYRIMKDKDILGVLA